MSDLNYIDRDAEVKLVGQDATGNTVNYVSADANGNLFVKDYSDGPVTPGTVASASALVGAQFNTVLPTLTNTQQSAIQVDSSGRLLIGSIASALPAGSNTIGAVTQASGPWTVSYLDIASSQSITVLDTGTSSLVGANGQVFYFATPTANSTASFTLSSVETIDVQVNILGGGGTLVTEVSMDGGSFWIRSNVFQIGTQSYTNSFVAPFVATINVSGMTNFRVRATVSWSGTGTILVKESLNGRSITIGDSLPTGSNTIGAVAQSGTWTVQQGTPPWTQNLTQVSGSAITLGQKASTASVPVVLASDQSAIPASQSGTWTIEPGNTANTNPWLTTDSADGSVTPGTVASKSILIGGQFNTVLPTLTNNQQAAIQVDSNGRILTSSFSVPTTASKFSFGELATTTSVSFLAVNSTAYTEPTTNSTMAILSSSANDTAAGTGARTVQVTYLDQTGAGPFTTSFTMNGTTAVNAGVSNMCFVEKITVLTVGSTGSNVGTLTLRTGGAVTVGTIAATNNQTFWAQHYIPTGKTCYVSGFSFGNNSTAAGNGAQFILKVSTPTIANTPEIQVSDFVSLSGASSSDTRTYISPIQVAGPARLRAYVLPFANAATTQFASFDFIDN